MAHNNSRFGIGGCFKCIACGKKTRETEDNDGTELCKACHFECSMENSHADGYHDGNPHPKCHICKTMA
jgi:hypothetical protein